MLLLTLSCCLLWSGSSHSARIPDLFGTITSDLFGVNSSKFVEWRFEAPKAEDFMLLIQINSISKNSFSAGSYFTLPDGKNLTESQNNLCTSYAPSGETNTCTQSLVKKYCPTANITRTKWPASIQIHTTSSYNDSNYHKYHLEVSFSYVFVFCPEQVVLQTTTYQDNTGTKSDTESTVPSSTIIAIILPILIVIICGVIIAMLLLKIRRLQERQPVNSVRKQFSYTNSLDNRAYNEIEITTRKEKLKKEEESEKKSVENILYHSYENITRKETT